ncbi:MAG: transketolase C-terminal domain-containing protein [Spirochaetia bacterium]
MAAVKTLPVDSHRSALGAALAILGQENSRMFVLSPDTSRSTGAATFRDAFPRQFLCTGVSEMHTLGFAAGLALEGFIPFVVGFGMFVVGKSWEPLRNAIVYPRLNVKVIATHCGINVGPDGVTHQMIEDLALTRAIPGLTVFAPADPPQVLPVLRAALDVDGPVYVRLERDSMRVVTDVDQIVHAGRGQVVRDGLDVTLIAIGGMVGRAMDAADRLAKTGVETRVINMVSVKPVDQELISTAAEETGALVTIEDHNRYGGLGSAVAESLAALRPAPLEQIALQDTFAESGPAGELYEKYGLSVEAIIRAARRAIARREPSKVAL